ncbi:MAG: DUF2336 domain-containing protein [Rhodospirillales bacterium]|nr:DUF2336 domain-containing protein [Rhodospirillales bacterium]
MSEAADPLASDPLAADSLSEAARVRRGSACRTPPGELERLATDPAVLVRAALALNPAAPPSTDRALARDPDPRVRTLLARKLAALAPALTEEEQGRLQRQTYATLGVLIEDTAEQVRAAIAEVVKAMPDAPRKLILRLARDTAVSVSEPVLRLSPILTEADLMALLDQPPTPGAACAIARRPALTEAVADAIAAGSDHAAIRALLANPSAQLREAALDGLIARAAEHVEWHEPLVRRPSLPPRSARALADIVATHLLDELAARADLDPAVAAELRTRLEARMDSAGRLDTGHAARETETAMAEAHRLARAGRLTEASVADAMRRGEKRLAAALLALACAMPIAAIDRAVALRNAKGLIALAWKAGFSMVLAGRLQSDLARLSPAEIQGAGPRGGYPLTVEEMRWQLEMLRAAT